MMLQYAGPILSVIMVVIGGAIVKVFIDRAFRSIDTTLKDMSTQNDEFYDKIQKLNEEIIRLQEVNKDQSKMHIMKMELMDRFVTKEHHMESFQILVSSITSLISKIDKIVINDQD